MTHDRHPMQAWLSVEKNNISIFQMAINYTTKRQFLSNGFSVTTYQTPAAQNHKFQIKRSIHQYAGRGEIIDLEEPSGYLTILAPGYF